MATPILLVELSEKVQNQEKCLFTTKALHIKV